MNLIYLINLVGLIGLIGLIGVASVVSVVNVTGLDWSSRSDPCLLTGLPSPLSIMLYHDDITKCRK